MATLLSITSGGIPSSGLFIIFTLLSMFNVPLRQFSLIYACDWLLSVFVLLKLNYTIKSVFRTKQMIILNSAQSDDIFNQTIHLNP